MKIYNSKTYDELQCNENYQEFFGICYDIIDQYLNRKKDKIVSVVDPDTRIAHKSPGKITCMSANPYLISIPTTQNTCSSYNYHCMINNHGNHGARQSTCFLINAGTPSLYLRESLFI